jgi:RNA polymerase sigma factor (sigma-70 family)
LRSQDWPPGGFAEVSGHGNRGFLEYQSTMVRLSDVSSEELLARTPGEPEAFGVFYDRFERQILAFFSRATGQPEVAADLTAEVFAAALAGAPSFDPALGSAQGWLFGIARHQLADVWEHGRVEDRARRRLGIAPLALRDEMLERIDELGATDHALRLLADLPQDQRLAVEGRVVQERDYAELARALECSESVVRQRVSRGLRKLRRGMREPS